MPRLHSPCLIIRADADELIGTGHIMRCLALAQTWLKQGGKVYFIGRVSGKKLTRRIAEEGCEMINMQKAQGTQEEIRMLTDLHKKQCAANPCWLVLDGYQFSSEYQRQVRELNSPLLVIDDYAHLPEYHADLLLNQNSNSEQLPYRFPGETHSIFGSRFLLLREEFVSKYQRKNKKIRPVARNIVVTMGGADPANATAQVIEALNVLSLPDLQVKIIVGPANQQTSVLENMLSDVSFQAELIGPVENMVPIMNWADLAITAGGSTCWELAYLGVPSLVVILVENQLGVAKGMAEAGAGINCGWSDQLRVDRLAETVEKLCVDKEKRTTMSRAGQKLVDGLGARRVVVHMMSPAIDFRDVSSGDCQLIFSWASDSIVRQASFHETEINWQEHQQWFQSKLEQKNCLFWIVCFGDQEIGQVRFDIEQNKAIISVSLAGEKRGQGSGSRVISAACHKLFAEQDVSEVIAFIRKENERSIQSFSKAGFASVNEKTCNGVPAVVMSCPAGSEVW